MLYELCLPNAIYYECKHLVIVNESEETAARICFSSSSPSVLRWKAFSMHNDANRIQDKFAIAWRHYA